MQEVTVQIVNTSNHPTPEYQTKNASGVDLYSNIPEEKIWLHAGETKLIPTGVYVAIPEGYEGQVRPRSGLAAKYGVTVLNTPGTIDADYRGEIKVILHNSGKHPYIVEDGERIAQLVFCPVTRVTFSVVNDLDNTDRGDGGFGSTGMGK